MIFPIAMRFRDGKTRRARGGGRFAPRVSWTKCAFRYALHPRPGQPRVRPTRRPLSPSPQRHRKSRFADASFAASSVAQSIVRSIGALDKPRRWSEGVVGGCGATKRSESVCTVVAHVVVKGKHWFARPTTRTTRRASHREK